MSSLLIWICLILTDVQNLCSRPSLNPSGSFVAMPWSISRTPSGPPLDPPYPPEPKTRDGALDRGRLIPGLEARPGAAPGRRTMFQRRESSSTSSRRESSNFKSSSCRVDLRALVDRAVIHLVGCRGGNEWLEGGPMKPTARLSSGIAAPSTCVAWTSWLPRIVACVVRSSQDQQAGRRQGGLSYSGAGAPAPPGPIPDGPPPQALG